MCTGNKLKIITAYSLTEEFETKRGLSQGSPVSPILWNLFLDPLLHWINEGKEGYNLEGYLANILAYADDMAILSSNNKGMQETINKLQEFCWHYGLEIGADKNKRDKSIYTNNKNNPNLKIYIRHLPEMIGKPDWYGIPYEATELPTINQEESYKYLRVHINLNLNWDKQKIITQQKLLTQLFYIKNKCFNITQTIEIINKVFIPCVTYRMNVINFDPIYLRKLDRYIANTVLYKRRLSYNCSRKELYFSKNAYGWGLSSLVDLGQSVYPGGLINHNLNATEAICIATSDFHAEQNSETWKDTQTLLQKCHSIQLNTTENRPKIEDINSYGIPQITTKKLTDNNIVNLPQLITTNNTLINPQSLIHLCKTLTTQDYSNIKTNICTHQSNNIHPYILHINNIEPKTPTNWLHNTTSYTINNITYQLIATDGAHSHETNMAAFSIIFGRDNPHNLTSRCRGIQSPLHAELQGLETTLITLPDNIHALIFTDCNTAYKNITEYATMKNSKRQKLIFREIYANINTLINKRK